MQPLCRIYYIAVGAVYLDMGAGKPLIMGLPQPHICRGFYRRQSFAPTAKRGRCPMADDKLPKPEDWHELAQRIQVETDPDKMIELVRELIARFDEQKLRKSLLPDRKAPGGPDCPQP